MSRSGWIRAWAFLRKEVVEIARQPRLVVTLVLAPFLILALFGVGYRQTTDPLRTMFVTEDESTFENTVAPRLEEVGGSLVYEGFTADRAVAIERLRTGEIDVVVIVPQDPEGTLRSSERAVFEVLHDRLDPYEQATIRLVINATVDAVNRSILEELVAEGQVRAGESPLEEAARTATALRSALEAGDEISAQREQLRLDDQLAAVEASTGPADAVLAAVREDFGASGSTTPGELRQRTQSLDIDSADVEAARALETELGTLNESVSEFRSIDPQILVSPFGADSDLVGAVELDVTDFYAPGVIALLLQHLAITFAALSLVRERALGTTELFRVSPLRATQLLVGKYAGYMAVSAVVAAALSALMLFGFGVPFVGSVGDFALVLALLVTASLGIGFVISSVVTTDTQAVNASMIFLLLSIFFSGFFLSIDRLVPEVQVVSWLLPITHALDSLRDVLFRGAGIDSRTILALGLGAIALFVSASLLTGRRLASE